MTEHNCKECKITHGDRIRKMTNKELASFFENKIVCPSQIMRTICIKDEIDNPDCKKCWLKFLNSEYEEK